MSNLKETKRRIGSVKNTQKITRAMKLVSAAKFSRAHQAVVSARPYGDTLDEMVRRLAGESETPNPLLDQRECKKGLLIIVSSDRGLCGGLNTNLFKKANAFLEEKEAAGISMSLAVWGRRAAMYRKKRKEDVVDEVEKVLDRPSYFFADSRAIRFTEAFKAKEYDRVYIMFSRFVNAMTQVPEVEQILPVALDGPKEDDKAAATPAAGREFIYEPEPAILLEKMLAKQISSRIFRVFLESAASEHAARMTAMDSATANADEVIKRLTLEYNRARQASITTELIEITSGAEAL